MQWVFGNKTKQAEEIAGAAGADAILRLAVMVELQQKVAPVWV